MSVGPERSAAGAADGVRFRVALRPGVVFPDWPAVESANATEALAAILSAFDLRRQWKGYGDDEDRFRRTLIEGLAELGRAPDLAWLARRTGFDVLRIAELIDRLQARDLVVRDPETGRVTGAYPLTARPTEHRVAWDGRTVHALCAVDALGVGAMVGADVTIESRCRACGAAIRATTKAKGTALGQITPSTTVVWAGIGYKGGCAATSICTTIAFFCTDAHLDEWRRANAPDAKGFRLAPDEAMQVGRAIFGPLLRPAETGREQRP